MIEWLSMQMESYWMMIYLLYLTSFAQYNVFEASFIFLYA